MNIPTTFIKKCRSSLTYRAEHFKKKFFAQENAHLTYSQCGEDVIVSFFFNDMKVAQPSYLDLGAHHPVTLSNTFLFYQRGSRGVCVEPDPSLYKYIKKVRGNDICLNVGVGTTQDVAADFYLMSAPTLNTFSKEEAERINDLGTFKIQQVIQIPLISVNSIIRDHFSEVPDFISLDVEGLDQEILGTFDFSQYRPKVFCVETLTYAEDGSQRKLTDIIDFMKARDYFVYADTYINSIFVDAQFFRDRQ